MRQSARRPADEKHALSTGGQAVRRSSRLFSHRAADRARRERSERRTRPGEKRARRDEGAE